MLRMHRSLHAYCATLWWRWLLFFVFPSNEAPMEWNWQGKTEVLGKKPVSVPLCLPQIPHELTRDRTRASAMRGRRLTPWAMARPPRRLKSSLKRRWEPQISLKISCSHNVFYFANESEINFKKQQVLLCMSLKFTWLTFQDERLGSGWPVCGVWRHRVGCVFSVRDRGLLWARAPEEPLARAQNALHSLLHSAFWNAWQVKNKIYITSTSECKDRYYVFPDALNWWIVLTLITFYTALVSYTSIVHGIQQSKQHFNTTSLNRQLSNRRDWYFA